MLWPKHRNRGRDRHSGSRQRGSDVPSRDSGSCVRTRGGFTIVELLVVIALIGVLLALILPAVMSARSSARRVECKNKLRQIGLGVLQQTEMAGRFPVAGYWGQI